MVEIGWIPLILLIIFFCALFIQLIYYYFIFIKLAFYNSDSEERSRDAQAVSIIICAKNESKNLKKYIYSVLEQVYPEFQVVIVNDCSWDDSGEFLEKLEKEYNNLKIVTISEQEKYTHGKKFALSLGIKAAKYDLLLLTDADCWPDSKNWLANMQSRFVEGVDIVLGYGAYSKNSGILNRLIRFDGFFVALQYLSFALAQMPYMGVGRNLGYRKTLFFKNKGFASHSHLLSGDDDLFINEVATSQNTRIEIKPESFVLTESKTTLKSWFKQKRRHTSTATHYKLKYKLLLSTLFSSHILFYLALGGLFIIGVDWKIILSAYLFRLISQFFIFGMSMKRLRETDLLLYLPLFDLFIIIFYIVLGISNLFIKPTKWK